MPLQPWNRLVRAAALTGLLALAWPALADTQSLVILHDNDIHGHLRSFCYIEVAKGPEEHCGVGGAARRATLIRRLKARATAPVLLIDGGDTTTRGPLATEYEGIDEVEVMNAMGYDMATLGNNEFKLKDDVDDQDAAGSQAALMKLVRRAEFPWLSANVTDDKGALLPGVQPFVVRRIGKLRIAFLGLTAPRTRTYPQTRGLVVLDPVEAAKVWIPRARAEADIVIAVTHIGVEDDRKLVAATRGIDAVVGADSHTFLYEPVTVKNLDGVAVPIVQDGEFGVSVGEFKLTFEGDATAGWKLGAFADRLVPVDAKVKPDPRIHALAESFAAPLDTPVGVLPVVGATVAERSRLDALTLARAWKASAKADVGFMPEASLYDHFRRLSVTRFEVRAVAPFHDNVWRGELTGDKLKAIVGRPAIASTIRPEDIDPARTYSVATTAFLGQTMLPGGADTGKDYRTAVEEWLATHPAP